MNFLTRFASVVLMMILSVTTDPTNRAAGQTKDAIAGADFTATSKQATEVNREERREFQSQELMLAKSGTWIFKPGETPRILWRDVETVRRLGCDEPLRVRWFDAELNESPEPNGPVAGSPGSKGPPLTAHRYRTWRTSCSTGST